MRILYITPELPFPPRTGGSLISYHHIRNLAPAHTVDLISFSETADPQLGDIAAWCGSIRTVRLPPDSRSRLRAVALKVMGVPREISRFEAPEMRRAVREALLTGRYDAAVFQSSRTGQYYPSKCGVPAAIYIEDPASLKLSRAAMRQKSIPMRLRLMLESALVRRYEREQAGRFDRILVMNGKDLADHEGQLGSGHRFEHVPYGIDVDAFPPGGVDERQRGMIVISGNMFHPPNVEGVLYFARRVFPRVSAAYPDAKLVLVGANPVEAIRSLAVENPHIEVTGTVPDVRPYLRRACVSACPVLLAIGTQTKILEAMASGTPVVTTIEGNHGIGAESGRELIIASSEKQFAASVVMLLQGEDWAGYSSRGRALVEARFDWRRIVGYLASVLETMIAERRAGQS